MHLSYYNFGILDLRAHRKRYGQVAQFFFFFFFLAKKSDFCVGCVNPEWLVSFGSVLRL